MRARNIKPGYFKNEFLATCDPLARILFSGLWCIADSRGVIEDRPKRIKAEALPYDDCDCNALLDQLHSKGFIVRYEVAGIKAIFIPTFAEHQRPHKGEKDFDIPLPDGAVCPTSPPDASKETPKDLFPPESGKFPTEPGISPTEPGKNPAYHESSLMNDESSFPKNETAAPTTQTNPEKQPLERPRYDEPMPPQTWPCFLVGEWCHYYRGTAKSERDREQLEKFFTDLIDRGIPPPKIRDRIRVRDRPRTEASWQFERFFAKGHANGNGRSGEGMAGGARVRTGQTADAARAKQLRQAAAVSPAVEERISNGRAPPL